MTSLSSLQMVATIAGITLATLATRTGVLLLGERLTLSRRVDAALRFAPVCALTALILPEVLSPSGVLDVSSGNPRLPAAIASAVFLLWRQSITGCIVVGMTVYALFRLW